MKNTFADYMINMNFKSAAELIYEKTLEVNIPKSVNLNINIDREKNINDLINQIENYFNQVNTTYTELTFDTLWIKLFESNELSEKQNLKDNEIILKQAKSEYDSLMYKIKKQQFEQYFETVTTTLNSTFQSIINAAINL